MIPRPAFLDRPTSIALDLVRIGAALAVLAGHSAQLGFYPGEWPFSFTLQHNAVIVFFVLSGLVVTHSVDHRPQTLADYAAARVARILPTAAIAVAFGLAAASFMALDGVACVGEPECDRPTASNVLLPLVFLSETLHTGAIWNAPFWSLCYEAWYYALFGAATFLTGRRRTVALALLALAAGHRALLLLPVWLLGVALARSSLARHTLRPAPAALLLAASLVAGVIVNSVNEPLAIAVQEALGIGLYYSEHFVTDWPLGVVTAIAFVAIKPFAGLAAPALLRAEPAVRTAAGATFALYLLHWPLLLTLRALDFHWASGTASYVLGLGAIALGCALVGRLGEEVGKRWRRPLARSFERLGREPAVAVSRPA